jgi:hypothetical protein
MVRTSAAGLSVVEHLFYNSSLVISKQEELPEEG